MSAWRLPVGRQGRQVTYQFLKFVFTYRRNSHEFVLPVINGNFIYFHEDFGILCTEN
jgi:hypothetical protein